MSITTPTSPTSNLESLRKFAQEFQPTQRRIPFRNLEPFRDSIETLRAKGASYAVIAALLGEHGVETSRARVAEYGRTVLDKQKPRKRRKPPQSVSSRVPPTVPSSPPTPPPSPPVVGPSSTLLSSDRTRGP